MALKKHRDKTGKQTNIKLIIFKVGGRGKDQNHKFFHYVLLSEFIAYLRFPIDAGQFFLLLVTILENMCLRLQRLPVSKLLV